MLPSSLAKCLISLWPSCSTVSYLARRTLAPKQTRYQRINSSLGLYSTIRVCQHGSTSLHLVCLTFYQHCCGCSCKTPSTLFHVLNTEFPEGPGWGLNREVLLSLKSPLLCHTGEKSTSATKKFIPLWFAKINEHIIRDRSVDHDLCLCLVSCRHHEKRGEGWGQLPQTPGCGMWQTR